LIIVVIETLGIMENISERKIDKSVFEEFNKDYFIVPLERKGAAKRCADLAELKASLKFAEKNLDLMYENKDNDLVFSFFTASLSNYNRCFASREGFMCLNKIKVFGKGTSLLASHQRIIDIRNELIGHRSESHYECSKVYLLRKKVGRELRCKAVYGFNLELTDNLLSEYQNLLDASIKFVDEIISDTANQVVKEFSEFHFGVTATKIK
jgi:hypothetical protein